MKYLHEDIERILISEQEIAEKTRELAKQIEIGESELEYIYTVFDSLTHAETVADMNEIREELYRSGYASKMKNSKISFCMCI